MLAALLRLYFSPLLFFSGLLSARYFISIYLVRLYGSPTGIVG